MLMPFSSLLCMTAFVLVMRGRGGGGGTRMFALVDISSFNLFKFCASVDIPKEVQETRLVDRFDSLLMCAKFFFKFFFNFPSIQ